MFTFNGCGKRWIPFDDSGNLSHGRSTFDYPSDLSDRGLTFNHTGNLFNFCRALDNPCHLGDGGLSLDCTYKNKTILIRQIKQINNLALSLVMSCISVNYLWWLFLKKKKMIMSDLK